MRGLTPSARRCARRRRRPATPHSTLPTAGQARSRRTPHRARTAEARRRRCGPPRRPGRQAKAPRQRCQRRGTGRGPDDRARLGHVRRRLVGGLGRRPIAPDGEGLRDEGLHNPHRRQAFGRKSRRVGKRVLSMARTQPHLPAGREQRQDDHRDRRDHERASFGLVTTIIATAPRNMNRLRSAIEAVAPNAESTCVVSAESREAISPVFSVSKNPGSSRSGV